MIFSSLGLMGAMLRIYKSRCARYDPWLSYLIISLLFLMMMVTALSFRVYRFMREWGTYIAGWTGKELVDSMVLAVCVVTEGWMDWQTTGWQYGTGSVCCDWRLDGLANNWLTVWYWQCVLWLKSKHWQASEMELWANCQINVDSALFVRLDVLFACVSHFTQPVLTHWTLTHLVAASSHMHWTLTHVAAASSHTLTHTGHLHM